MNKNIGALNVIMIVIIFIRCIFKEDNNIMYIVAGINIVAIVFVLYTIVERVLDNIITKIKKSAVPSQIIEREIKSVRLKIWGWSTSVSMIVILLYFWQWCSSLGNDIISILALGISVQDEEIIRRIAENYKI